MASRAKTSSRHSRDGDSLEALKPVVVLVLFGTILYGAYSVVQKGPSSDAESVAGAPAAVGEPPPFMPPAMPVTAPQVAVPNPAPTTAAEPPASPSVAAQDPLLAAVAAQGVPSASAAPAAPVAAVAPTAEPVPQPAPPVAQPAAQPVGTPDIAAASPTYLDAQSAAPPSAATLDAPAGGPREDRFAALATAAASPTAPRGVPAGPTAPVVGSSAAFATAWADAHDKLTSGRYAEALAALSIWYDDPSLGLEESQKLEDLLGQLAGTVVYSQQDLLLPPHVVAAGETLASIAAPLGLSPRLLAKINGISDPQQLVPGEHLKLVRGPFDAVVSVSRRRLSLQLNGSYAGSFPVVVGRQFLGRVGGAVPVAAVRPAGGDAAAPQAKPAIILGEGLLIEAAEDPGMATDNTAETSLVVSVRDLHELLDILGPGSRVLVRQ